MENLVSIVIPNYNGSKYIQKCIESLQAQSYKDVEIIVVDDGSTDDSLSVLERLKQQYGNLQVLTQCNQNASIARNKGIEIAKGKYLYFMDADDLACENGIKSLVEAAEASGADFAIGNMEEIDAESNLLKGDELFTSCEVIDNSLSLSDTEIPAPSNKLFLREVVLDNDIRFGNVRIGQDLNFFFKYLLCSAKAVTTTECIYQWRVEPDSISHKRNFRIFDITESFADVKRFYIKHNAEDKYNYYLIPQEYSHYYGQMEKQKYYINRKDRSLIINYFRSFIEKIPLSDCSRISQFKKMIKACRTKIFFKSIYASKFYGKIKG